MNKILKIQAFFRMVDEDNNSANVRIENDVICGTKEFSTNELYDKLKDLVKSSIPGNVNLFDMSQEDINKINEEDSCISTEMAIAKNKYFNLFKKYDDNDTIDIKTAKEMINAIFDDKKNQKNNNILNDFDCFVIGTTNAENTINALGDGGNVFLNPSYINKLDQKVNIKLIDEIIASKFKDYDFNDIYNFCTSFLLGEAQGAITKERIDILKIDGIDIYI